jgi:2-phospho-L-lactate/phosphoenolpyruvate guanylyltransferase
MKVFAVVFAKESAKSKRGLSATFSPEECKLLSAALLEDVLVALKSSVVREVVVVGTDSSVQQVVEYCGGSFISQERSGLASAVQKIIAWGKEKKADSLLVLPDNIPLISSSDIDRIVELGSEAPSVVLSPSMKGGTNAVFLNPSNLIPVQFGPNSFFKLVKEAIDKDVALRFYSSREIALDGDSEADLCKLLEIENNTVSKRVFEQIRLKRNKKS